MTTVWLVVWLNAYGGYRVISAHDSKEGAEAAKPDKGPAFELRSFSLNGEAK